MQSGDEYEPGEPLINQVVPPNVIKVLILNIEQWDGQYSD